MRKIAFGIAAILLLGLVGLLVAPQFVNLDRYRPEIADRLSSALGRPVTLAGPISLSLLPTPYVSVRDLRIANLPGGSAPDMVRVREVDAALAFWPLLAFKIDVTSARIVQPSLLLERLPDGRANWTLAGSLGSTSAAPKRGPTTSAEPAAPSAGMGAGTLRIASLSIEDGTLTYRAAGSSEVIEHINLRLTGDAVSGPLHAEGGFTTLGATLATSVDIGRFTEPKVPVYLALRAPPMATAEFNGDLRLDGAAPQLAGKLVLKGDDLGAVAALAGSGPLPPMLSKPLSIAADVTAAPDGVLLDHLALDLGDIHGNGKVRVTPGTPLAVQITFAVNTLDVDRFLAERAAAAGTAVAKSKSKDAVSAALPRDAGTTGAGRFALPPNVNASLDLRVDGLQWRQGVMREARLEATLANGRLSIKRLGALLPGGSDFALSGTLDTIGALPKFTGRIEASTDNARDLLRWAGVNVAGVPAERLRRATLSSKIAIDSTTIEVQSVDMGFDAARVTGAATIALRDRPAFGARVVIDQLNLDAYLGDEKTPPAQGAPKKGAPPAAAGAAAIRNITVPEAVADALASFDANLDATVDTLIWRNQPIRKVHLVGTLQNRDLTLREFSVSDLGGATGKLSGYVQAIGAPKSKAQAAFDMRGPELSRVLRLLAPSVASAETFGPFALGGEVQRQGERLTLDVDLEAAGGKLRMVGSTPTADSGDLELTLDHPSFNRLMRLASPSYRPQGGELGAVKLHGRVGWAPNTVTAKDISLNVGGMTAGGGLKLALAGRPTLTATLTVGDLVIDKFLPLRQTAFLDNGPRGSLRPGVILAQAGGRAAAGERWSRVPVDLAFLKLFDADVALGGKSVAWGNWRLVDPNAKLLLKDAVLTVPNMTGQLFGGALTASAAVNAAATPTLDVKAMLTGADLKQALAPAGVSRVEGRFDTKADLAGAGASPFDLITHLNGAASLQSRNGVINGINVPAINQRINQIKGLGDLAVLLRAATSGSTRYSSLDGTFKVAGGVAVSNDLHLVADGGEGTGTATINFPNWTIVSRTDLHLMGVQGSPPLGVTLKGPLDQPDWDIDFSRIAQSVGTRAIERLIVPRLEPKPSEGQQQAPQQTPQPLQPQDLLRNLFRR